jgi:hypothetical protein
MARQNKEERKEGMGEGDGGEGSGLFTRDGGDRQNAYLVAHLQERGILIFTFSLVQQVLLLLY